MPQILCVEFCCFESRGLWHNRARAKICRYFKNHPPSEEMQAQLVIVVSRRLRTGYFTEQFKDQLAMAIRFSPSTMLSESRECFKDPRDYVRRYGAWVENVVRSAYSTNFDCADKKH